MALTFQIELCESRCAGIILDKMKRRPDFGLRRVFIRNFSENSKKAAPFFYIKVAFLY